MNSSDQQRFTRLLDSVLSIYGRERSDMAAAMWAKLLAPFAFEDVDRALCAHVQASKFAPTPADIIATIQATDGRPTAEEAWAMCPRGEGETVVWTEETSQASGAVHKLLAAGDQVAARMAFKDVYERAVRSARASRLPVRWVPSLGHDPDGREGPLLAAVQSGRIGAQAARAFLLASKGSGGQIAAIFDGMVQAKRIEHALS